MKKNLLILFFSLFSVKQFAFAVIDTANYAPRNRYLNI